MKTLKILYAMLLVFTVGFVLYNEQRIDELRYGHEESMNKIQENRVEMRSLKRKLYNYEVIQAENILRKSKKYWIGEVVFLDFRGGEVILQLNDYRYGVDIENKIITSY